MLVYCSYYLVQLTILCFLFHVYSMPRSHRQRHAATKRQDPIHFNGALATSGDTRDGDRWQQNVGVSSDKRQATKVENFQLYANEKRFSRATTNRKEDFQWSSAHVTVSSELVVIDSDNNFVRMKKENCCHDITKKTITQ